MMVSFYGKWGEKEIIEVFDDVERVFVLEQRELPIHVILIWSLMTTDFGRLDLQSYFSDTTLYWDTDGFMDTKILPISNELGKLKIEAEFDSVNILAAKTYVGEKSKKVKKVKFKGVPTRAYKENDNYIESKIQLFTEKGGELTYKRPEGISSSFRKTKQTGNFHHPTRWILDSKRLVHKFDSRKVLSNGVTIPWEVDQW
jgi:hypothetical protein